MSYPLLEFTVPPGGIYQYYGTPEETFSFDFVLHSATARRFRLVDVTEDAVLRVTPPCLVLNEGPRVIRLRD